MSEATNPNAATSGSGYRWIGQSMKRVEDPRLLTGRGKYIDDVVLPNMAHAAVLRSPYAHARIKSIDTSRAEALPGVVLVMTGAPAAGQPVKFLEDRIDNITSCDNHGSDRVYDMEVAVMNDGTITSLRMKVIDDYGAYLQFGVGHHGNAAAQLTGPYRIGSGEIDLTAVLTNTCQQGAYRGFGSEVTNFVLERMVDAAAEELEMDPVEIRRKNFIQPDQFPYKIPTGNVYDSGNYEAVLDKALEMVDYCARRSLVKGKGHVKGQTCWKPSMRPSR